MYCFISTGKNSLKVCFGILLNFLQQGPRIFRVSRTQVELHIQRQTKSLSTKQVLSASLEGFSDIAGNAIGWGEMYFADCHLGRSLHSDFLKLIN